MTNTLPNLAGAAAPSPRVIANLKQLARTIRPASLYVVVGEEDEGPNVTLSFRVPLNKN